MILELISQPVAATSRHCRMAALTLLALCLCLAPGRSLFAQADEDPTTAPIPAFQFDDPSRSIYVELQFNSAIEVEETAKGYSTSRARTHLADPEQLRVEIYDTNGQLIEALNQWHPLWAHVIGDSSESLEIQQSGPAFLVFPLHGNATAMKLVDVALAQTLITVDLEPVIWAFCGAEPAHQECQLTNVRFRNGFE